MWRGWGVLRVRVADMGVAVVAEEVVVVVKGGVCVDVWGKTPRLPAASPLICCCCCCSCFSHVEFSSFSTVSHAESGGEQRDRVGVYIQVGLLSPRGVYEARSAPVSAPSRAARSVCSSILHCKIFGVLKSHKTAANVCFSACGEGESGGGGGGGEEGVWEVARLQTPIH